MRVGFETTSQDSPSQIDADERRRRHEESVDGPDAHKHRERQGHINADLRNADLRDSTLIDTDFSGANLSNADLTGATFRGVRGLDTAITSGTLGLP